MLKNLFGFAAGTIAHHISFDSGFYLWQHEMGPILNNYIESWAITKIGKR